MVSVALQTRPRVLAESASLILSSAEPANHLRDGLPTRAFCLLVAVQPFVLHPGEPRPRKCNQRANDL